MKKLQTTIILFLTFLPLILNGQVIKEFAGLNGNNVSAPFINTGIFDRNIELNNAPGYEWPKGSNQYAIFTAGLTLGAYINGVFHMAAASYEGEYAPGYIQNGQAHTNSDFKLYKVKTGDNQFNNPDYANWGLMVPYGAPFTDVNNNGIYEAAIDKPGVDGATQTIFLCMTDGFPDQHNSAEGFGGGTNPMYAEVHLTAWCYNQSGLENVQFIKWDIINKSGFTWNGAISSIVCDPDLGDANDDLIGCDKPLQLGYCYNGDNNDGTGAPPTYGVNPPAVGISFLKTPLRANGTEYGLTSFSIFTSGQAPFCWYDPSNPNEAYNYMKGLQRDGTPYVNAVTMNTTRHVFDGNPESGDGWTEADGRIENCGGDTIGTLMPSPPGDRRFVINTGDSIHNFNNGQMITVVASQHIARGSNYLNSVTKLKQLTNVIHNYWQTIGITPISSEVPESFRLHQNYPNPFNPSTKIRFEIPSGNRLVKLTVYDISGKEVARLVNEELQAGAYEYDFSATDGGLNLSSGMYFYRLETGSFVETKKMVLVK